MRIRVRHLLSSVLALLALYVSSAFGQASEPVRLQSGLVSGTTANDPSVRVFRGIPFAEAPVGDLRWRAPRPAASWEGILEADEFSAGCVQSVVGSRPPWTDEFMHQGDVSEDCLYLNVWTAARGAGERRPVLVYIHGGGFNEGSGSVAVYDGEELAKKGLVVVTINYRLGVLGFLAHPDLTAESSHEASGNYGLLDQVASLEWIRDNIAAFGGSPANVTIAGQSAGAISVYLITASPLAKGLFHRAIVQSGPGGLASFGLASTRTLAGPLADAEPAGVEFAAERGASSIKELRAMSADELTASPPAGSRPRRFGAVIDGHFLPDDVASIYARGEQIDVPMIMGFNADEASAFPGYGKVTADEFREAAGRRYGVLAEEFLALYPARSEDDFGRAQTESLRDLGFVALARVADERALSSDSDVYVYYFDRGIPWPERPEFGAFHTAEVPYVFNNLDVLDRPWEPVDRQLAEAMSSYWSNFASKGDPSGLAVPTWPAFGDSSRMVMILGRDVIAQPFPVPEERRQFFESFLEMQADN